MRSAETLLTQVYHGSKTTNKTSQSSIDCPLPKMWEGRSSPRSLQNLQQKDRLAEYLFSIAHAEAVINLGRSGVWLPDRLFLWPTFNAFIQRTDLQAKSNRASSFWFIRHQQKDEIRAIYVKHQGKPDSGLIATHLDCLRSAATT